MSEKIKIFKNSAFDKKKIRESYRNVHDLNPDPNLDSDTFFY